MNEPTDMATCNNDSVSSTTTATVAADQTPPVSDFRTDMMRMPVEMMKIAQDEYVARRKQFREWLLSQLQVGIHFGYVPGTEPKFVDEHGRDCNHTKAKGVKVWKKGYGNKQDGWDVISFASWTAKPSLYKAGAQFVVDLLNLIPVYEADLVGWQQLGSPPGVFIYSCRLYPKGGTHIQENLKGEGRGVRKVGQKGGDENNAIKMAQKSALVDAVLNGFGLGDLFCQDLEDMGPVQHEAPEVKPNAPKTQPRNDRCSQADFDAVKRSWAGRREERGLEIGGPLFAKWCFERQLCAEKDALALASWSVEMVAEARRLINQEMPEGA